MPSCVAYAQFFQATEPGDVSPPSHDGGDATSGSRNRCITWPQRALGYKIGQLKIRERRSLAEKIWGQRLICARFMLSC